MYIDVGFTKHIVDLYNLTNKNVEVAIKHGSFAMKQCGFNNG